MKVFIAGSDKVYAIENFYVKYLRELGVNVFHFPSQSIFYDYYQRSLVNKLIFKSGISFIFKKISTEFKKSVEDFSPEVIWIFKGMEIHPSFLRWAKEKKIKLVNFNGDSPFVFSGSGSGNSYVKDAIGLYDLHLTYNLWVKNEMDQKYKISTAILPFGFDISTALYEKCCKETEVVNTCFLGNPDKYRGGFLQQLAEKGVKLDVYGCHWEKFVRHANIRIYEPVYGDDFWLVLRRYRIQLNLMRPHNPDTHNMRTFEIPGVGGIQLAPDTIDHKTYFEAGKEIFLFKNISDCKMQIDTLLALSAKEAAIVREAARERSILSGYSYQARAAQALEKFKEVF